MAILDFKRGRVAMKSIEYFKVTTWRYRNKLWTGFTKSRWFINVFNLKRYTVAQSVDDFSRYSISKETKLHWYRLKFLKLNLVIIEIS